MQLHVLCAVSVPQKKRALPSLVWEADGKTKHDSVLKCDMANHVWTEHRHTEQSQGALWASAQVPRQGECVCVCIVGCLYVHVFVCV